MRKKYAVLTFVIASLVVLMMAVGSARAVTIDSFDVTAHGITASEATDPTTSGFQAAPEAIGGSRKLEILSVTGPLSADLDVVASGLGILSLSNDALTASTARVTWDAFGAGLGGGAGVDLTTGGADSIGIDLLFIDQGLVDLTVNIKDTDGDVASLLLAGVGVGQNVFGFSDFANAINVDFGFAHTISLDITAGAASDLIIDFFETQNPQSGNTSAVPEPGTVALLGIGLAGLGGGYLRRRFRRKSQSQE